MGAEDEFAQAIGIISGLYYFLTVKRADSLRYSHIAQSNICYCIDDELLYEPFFADFGPLNLGRTYRFCQKTKLLLQEAERNGKRLFLYAGPHAHQKANAAVLVGIYQVLFLNRTADAAYKPLSVYKPYVPFRDASCGVSTFHLTVYDVVRGIQKARDVGFIDWNSGSSTWSLEEYEYYEQVENGDLNWIVPGKFAAFSGPAARSNEIAGYRLHTPEDYWDYFRRKGITTVVRLNKKVYDRKRFLDGGFKHHEMYFPDGSCPNDAIIQRFLDTVEAEPGAIAVHCKAGLGRTGLLICLYIMKHYRFTAEEVIGYIRVCRPGSVIGPQQNFIREMEARMWHDGELYRAARGLPQATPAVADLMVSGRAAGHAELAASPTPISMLEPGGVSSNGRNGYHVNGSNGSAYGQSRPSNTGGSMGVGVRSSLAQAGGGSYLSAGGGAAAAAASAGVPPPASDMSLLQYSKLQQYGSGAQASSPYLQHDYGSVSSPAVLGAGAAASPYISVSSSYSAGVASISSFRNRYNGGAGAGYGNGAGVTGVGRSMTPLRYSQQSVGSGYHHHMGAGGGAAAGGYYASHGGPLQSSVGAAARGSIGMSAVSRSMNVGVGGGSGVAGRSPSTGRLSVAAGLAAPPGGSTAAALRSTLHTDTLGAADRPKLVPERNTQSADIGSSFGLGGTSLTSMGSGGGQPGVGGGGGASSSSSWRISVAASSSVGSSGPGTPTSGGSSGGGGGGASNSASGLNRTPSLSTRNGVGAVGGPNGAVTAAPGSTTGGVARILAPNGQPRKVPVALLSQYAQQQQQQQQQQQSQSAWASGAGGAAATVLGSSAISGPKPPPGAPPSQMRSSYSYGLRQ